MFEIVLRSPGPPDEPAIVAMFDRCSFESRYARFLNPARHLPATHLHDVLHGPAPSRSLVVVHEDTVVGLGTCHHDAGVGEIGILVEDAWQQQGIGSTMLDALVDDARAGAVHTINAFVLADRRHVLRWLARRGPHLIRVDGETAEIQILLGVDARSAVCTSQAEARRSTANSSVVSGSANDSRIPW
jgi:N-acetylglutamate synthase-like GNAT family acetyltransferase